MLVKPKFKYYRQAGVIQFMNNLLEVLTPTIANTLQLAPQRDSLQSIMDELNEKWQPENVKIETMEIRKIDLERGRILYAFQKTVEAWSKGHFDPNLRWDAEELYRNLLAHGKRIHKLRYQEETAKINALIRDWETTHSAQISALGLTDWVINLKNLNHQFDQKYVHRTIKMARQHRDEIAPLVQEAKSAYLDLDKYFSARKKVAEMDNSPTVSQYQDTENFWNQVIEDYNA